MGNTTCGTGNNDWQTVHPHTSGEYILQRQALRLPGGSSPHKWGIRHQHPERQAGLRFIPTQVGNTVVTGTLAADVTVHPHTSGEYNVFGLQLLAQNGSSPHKWGIPLLGSPCNVCGRFIPTQVGNTSCMKRAKKPIPVHPHTSGEYASSITTSYGTCGSSPHKWGIQSRIGPSLYLPRFIPTQVGNTAPECPQYPAKAVHPHTSGEYVNMQGKRGAVSGSSPHKWGIHHPLPLGEVGGRFIPTQVGNTPSRRSHNRC